MGTNVSAVTLKGRNLTMTPDIDGTVTHVLPNVYSFQFEPSREYTIEADIRNTGAENQRYQAEIEDAYTNQNGQLVYRETDNQQGIRNLTDNPQKTGTIAPYGTEHIVFHLKTSEAPFDGVKIGGLRVTELAQTSNTAIKNNISLITSIVMGTGEVETTAVSDLDIINVVDIFAANKRGYEFKFDNDSTQLLTNAQATLTLYNHDERILEKTLRPITIAPNTPFKLFLPVDGRPEVFTKATVVFKKGDQEKTVSFNNKKPSKKTVRQPERQNWGPYYWGGGVLVAGLIGGVYCLVKRGNRDGT
jgi:Bacterial protein of unknown function (DUF916).